MAGEATDASLLESARAGRVRAFTTIVERHQSLVCAVTFGLTGDRHLSEDLAQETFLVAWQSLDEVRRPEALRGWLCGIARNLGHKARRRRRPEAELDTVDLPADETDLENELADRELQALVYSALQKIPASYRDALVLYYREGRSAEQVAHALGLTVSAVEQRLSRGRKYLRAGVARIVERTLERTRPSKAFFSSVSAALPPRPLLPQALDAVRASDTASPCEGTSSSASPIAVTRTVRETLIGSALATIGVAGVSTFVIVGGEHTSLLDSDAVNAQPASSSPSLLQPDPRQDTQAEYDERPRDLRTRREVEAEQARGEESGSFSLRYELTEMSVGRYAVNMAGGRSELDTGQQLGLAPEVVPPVIRTLRGRIRDASGNPVAGAIVLGGHRLGRTLASSLSGEAGAVTETDGRYALDVRTEDAIFVVAMHGTAGWSRLAELGPGTRDRTLNLHLEVAAGIQGKLTRGGEPFAGAVKLIHSTGGARFELLMNTNATGEFVEARLPPGEFTAIGSEGRFAFNGIGGTARADVTLRPGETATLALDIARGTLLAVDAALPEGHGVEMLEYTLVPGEHAIANPPGLRALTKKHGRRSMLWGGRDVEEVMQFHDLQAGHFTVCVEAKDEAAALVGIDCAVVHIDSRDELTEVVLTPLHG